ncbi:hypothetical protein AE749_15440 [Bacteroides fragilis]|uniref:hypothetical protein n=1 Tax=Bacteroides fragilis TaxID=817 RepID=UPI0008109368|nr:hypothetical protein [Bacteroides fragilis]OCM97108.1 hypothetical protein AE749_15440 [Bacteroides fragilis]
MSFEGEFASYEPLRRVLDSAKIKALQNRMRIHKSEETLDTLGEIFVHEKDLPKSKVQPDLILAIDGSCHTAKAVNGFPGAEFGYVTIASVLIDAEFNLQMQQNSD